MQLKLGECRTVVATIFTQMSQLSDRYETCLSGRECHYENAAIGCLDVALRCQFMSFPAAADVD